MVMKTKKISVSLCMVVILVISIGGIVSAAYQGWDLVDSGKHLDYDGNSSYMSSVTAGAKTWNAYKAGVIRRDSLLVIEDVYVSDYSEVSTTLGYTSESGTISFNTYKFKSMTSAQRQKTATHELGHALGLSHTSGTKDIMKQGILSTVVLSSTDKSSYNTCYKKY